MGEGLIPIGGGGPHPEYPEPGLPSDGYADLWRAFSTDYPPAADVGEAEALWIFDGSADALTDRTSNGHDLTLNHGSEYYVNSRSNVVGLGCGPTEQYLAANPAGLRILGDLTVEAIIQSQGPTLNNDSIIEVGGGIASDLETQNMLYTLRIHEDDSRYMYFSEHGAGVNDEVTFKAMMMSGDLEYIAYVRSASDGNVKCYQNARLMDTQAITMPTGGSLAIVSIANGSVYQTPPGDGPFHGAIYALRVWARALTAAQIEQVYTYCRGRL